MACFNPLRGWRSKAVNPSGKRSIVFDRSRGYEDLPVEVPCGQCVGCRLERSRVWAIRCVHEASLYDDNCFITLTYADENLPENNSLDKSAFPKFMKRLRKRFPNLAIRYFMCGEYGEKFTRPHYHACLFNFDFADKSLWSVKNGIRLYTSPTLSELWPFGYSIIGDVTFDSAAYVARYIMKKITGEKAQEHYGDLQPEFCTMSRRPGLGKGWYDKYSNDLFPHDRTIINGKEVTVPKFYRQLHELDQPKVAFLLKTIRKKLAVESDDNTIRRLRDREVCLKARLKSLTREIESENNEKDIFNL
jgi:hypothetical protein